VRNPNGPNGKLIKRNGSQDGEEEGGGRRGGGRRGKKKEGKDEEKRHGHCETIPCGPNGHLDSVETNIGRIAKKKTTDDEESRMPNDENDE